MCSPETNAQTRRRANDSSMGSRITSLYEYRASRGLLAHDEALFLTQESPSCLVVALLCSGGGAVGLLSAPAANHNGEAVLGWMLSADAARQLAAQLLVEADALDGGAGGAS